MKLKISTLVFSALLSANLLHIVHSYCLPGTDMTFGHITPKKGQKISIPLGSGATLEVRYTGNPKVKWYFNGKEIPMTAKSKHFEFVNVGISFPKFGPILKIKNFKKELAGDYKVEIQKSGCAYSKIIKVEVDNSLNLKHYMGILMDKVPYFKTKAGSTLLIAGLALFFIVIPLMICGALCAKINLLKKELNERKGGGSSYGRGKAAQKSKDKSLAREDTVLLN